MGKADIIVLSILVVIVAIAIWRIRRSRKECSDGCGKCQCREDCRQNKNADIKDRELQK